MSVPSKNKWRWLASLAHVFILFICDGAFLPSADHVGLSFVHASPSSGMAVAVVCCLYWEGWEGSNLLCGFRYSASRRAESDDADQTGVVRRHRCGQERSMIVKDADCHVQIQQMVKGLCFHGVFLVIFFNALQRGNHSCIHSWRQSFSRISGLSILLKDTPTWRVQEPRDGGDRRHINLAGVTGPGCERLLIHEPAADSFLMCNKLILLHSPAMRFHSLVDKGLNKESKALQRTGSLKLALLQPCVGDNRTRVQIYYIYIFYFCYL